MNRKTAYIIVASVTFGIGVAIVSMWLVQARVFRPVSWDGTGGGGFGISKRGLGVSTTTWVSSDGIRIEEFTVSYASAEEAREDFNAELKSAETIADDDQSFDYPRNGEREVIGTFINPYSQERTAKIIKHQDTEIYHADARSLDDALAFKRSWLKLNF